MSTPDPLRYRLRLDVFKELTEAKGWMNDLQAAQKIGVSHTTISRIKHGDMHPGDKFMSRATAALGVTHDELFVREREQVSA